MSRYIPFAATAAVLILMSPVEGADSISPVSYGLPEVMVNDNRRPAGTRGSGTLVLELRAAVGFWRPEGAKGPALQIEAFGERTGPLQAPAPLIRVPEGTEIVASIRNDLDVTLRVHGLCSHDATPCEPIELTHLHDDRQLTSGMYGALLVLEEGDTFDPTLDHVIVIGRGGPGKAASTVVNGVRDPQFTLKAGAVHRLRLINITPDDIFVVSLAVRDRPATWRPLTKDGAPVPPDRRTDRPATQTIAVGETFDFEYQAPAGRQTLWMEVRTPAGRWHVQGRVAVK